MACCWGTLASINLWELPTYFGLGILALAVSLYREGRLRLPLLFGGAVGFLAVAYLSFLPFFRNYTNVGASGVGMVRQPDNLGLWLLIWGFFIFVSISWLVTSPGQARPGPATPAGALAGPGLGQRRWYPPAASGSAVCCAGRPWLSRPGFGGFPSLLCWVGGC